MTNERIMPKYQGDEQVWALKIKSMTANDVGAGGVQTHTMTAEDERYGGVVTLSQEYIDEHSPEHGGYYIVQANGDKAYSSAEAFEDGYALI